MINERCCLFFAGQNPGHFLLTKLPEIGGFPIFFWQLSFIFKV